MDESASGKRYLGFSTDIPMMTRMTRLTAGLLGYYAVSLILLRPDVLCNLPRSVLYKTSGTQAGGIMLRLPETNGTRSDCTIHRFLYNPIYRESPGPSGPGLSLVITDSKFIRTPSQSSQFSFLTLRLSGISLILNPFCCFAVHICSCFFWKMLLSEASLRPIIRLLFSENTGGLLSIHCQLSVLFYFFTGWNQHPPCRS
ncbi:hypothetical protein [[Clostridium] aminophilum]|uniref:hypothetical protein n=1 Tax=[Clostridium] aminophilum TaxID=1526 RepID=UPI0026EF862C|nr:hypothetical protein [[Clostridium] aminophilum]